MAGREGRDQWKPSDKKANRVCYYLGHGGGVRGVGKKSIGSRSGKGEKEQKRLFGNLIPEGGNRFTFFGLGLN